MKSEVLKFRNGACMRSLTGRWNFLCSIIIFIATMLFSACKKDSPVNRNIDGKTSTGEAVMVMDPSMVSSKLEEITTDGTLVFNNLAAEDMPEKGDIICSAPSSTAPQGFLYRVKDVTTTGNKTTIVTEETTLEEAVEEADVDETLDLTILEIEVEEGVEIEESEQTPKSQISTKASATLEIKIEKIKIDKKIDENIHIKGSIDIGANVRCEVKVEWFQVKRFLLTTQPKFKAQLAATIEGKIEKEKKINIATLKYSPVTVWVGVIPLVFTPKLSIDAIITTKGEVKLQATLVDWDYSYTFGVRYQNGKLEAISEDTSKPAKYLEEVQLVLTGEVKLQPKLSYRYDLYNSGTYAGMFGDFYAKLKVQDNVGSDIKLSFSCGLEFGADAQLKILGKKLGTLKLSFLSLEWLIWEKLWGLSANDPNFWKPQKGDVYVAGGGVIKNGVTQYLDEGSARSVYVYGSDVYITSTIYVSDCSGVPCDVYNAFLWKNGVLQYRCGAGYEGSTSVFVSGSDVYVADDWTLWKNGVGQNFGTSVSSVFVSGSDVYVAGGGGIATLWKNGVAQNLGYDGHASSVFVSGNDVYVAGNESIDYWTSVAKLWKNGVLQDLTDGTKNSIAQSVFVSGNDVYVAGYFYSNNYTELSAFLWKNGEVYHLGEGNASSVYVSENDVYVVGTKLWKNGEVQKLADGTDHPGGNSVFVVE